MRFPKDDEDRPALRLRNSRACFSELILFFFGISCSDYLKPVKKIKMILKRFCGAAAEPSI
jgi:hypothetical protein